MTAPNLRHLRVVLAVAEGGTLSAAAARCRVSQPAVSQALAKLERDLGGALFQRRRQGVFLTDRGAVFAGRVGRAMARLDMALAQVSPRLIVTATAAQMRALMAMAETQNFTLAARALGLAQPSVHRAITQIEQDAGTALFDRRSFGMVATRPALRLAQAARLAFAELEQAKADLAEFDGRDGGRVVVGALPLARSVVLPEALARFHAARPRARVTVFDGAYDEMLAGLRRGDIDLILGALRDPAPIYDVVQEPLFADRLACLAKPGHPLAGMTDISLATLAKQAWVVPRQGVPARAQFDALFRDHGLPVPEPVLECGSILLMREMLHRGDLVGCISAQQAEAEIARGLLARLDTGIDWPDRAIGLTYRADWVPTGAQTALLTMIRAAAKSGGGSQNGRPD